MSLNFFSSKGPNINTIEINEISQVKFLKNYRHLETIILHGESHNSYTELKALQPVVTHIQIHFQLTFPDIQAIILNTPSLTKITQCFHFNKKLQQQCRQLQVKVVFKVNCTNSIF